MTKRDPFHTILHPDTVVVVGASNNPMKMGTLQAMNVVRNDFAGDVYFLHPREKEILGRPAFPKASDLPVVPDVAILVTPAPITVKVFEELGEIGVRHAVVITAGFREVGTDGATLDKKLVEIAQRYGIRFVGPNCIGVLNMHHPFNTTVLPNLQKAGALGLVSQSGTFVSQLPVLLNRDSIRLGKAISVGNSSNTDLVDWLEYMGRDDKTRAVALYIEGINDPRRFVEVASRVTAVKPVFALYSGSTEAGQRAGHSHTAALGGPDRLYQAMFDQAGVVRASTVAELFDWAWTASVSPIPKGKRVGIVTHSGGPASCMADECALLGLKVPVFSDELQARIREHVLPNAAVGNPIDMTFFLDTKVFCEVLPRLVMESGEVDAVLVHGLMDTGFAGPVLEMMEDRLPMPKDAILQGFHADVEPIFEYRENYQMPIVGSTFVWDDHANKNVVAGDVPVFTCPYRAVRALDALWRAAQRLNHEPCTLELNPVSKPAWTEGIPSGTLDEGISRKVVEAYGVPVSEFVVVDSPRDAAEAAKRFPETVVLKGLAPGVAHKSEAGLVAVGLKTGEVEAAAETMRSSGAQQFIVTRFEKGTRELVVGLTRKPGFGPLLMLGLGGIFAEGLDDAVFRLAPVTSDEVPDMLESLKSHRVFQDYRHMKAVDMEALKAIFSGLSNLALAHPDIEEVDLNPILVRDDGSLVAADALVVGR